jgi:hypothetical protein
MSTNPPFVQPRRPDGWYTTFRNRYQHRRGFNLGAEWYKTLTPDDWAFEARNEKVPCHKAWFVAMHYQAKAFWMTLNGQWVRRA